MRPFGEPGSQALSAVTAAPAKAPAKAGLVLTPDIIQRYFPDGAEAFTTALRSLGSGNVRKVMLALGTGSVLSQAKIVAENKPYKACVFAGSLSDMANLSKSETTEATTWLEQNGHIRSGHAKVGPNRRLTYYVNSLVPDDRPERGQSASKVVDEDASAQAFGL